VAGLGLQLGDEVICTAAAPIFSALPIFAAGAIPVFADVDPQTFLISPEGIEARISDRTKAVMVVHLWGRPAPMDEILQVAAKHGLKVIEDCAQAFDSYCRGKKVGTIGDVTCFSLQQSKHITSGEGGFILTDDPDIYKRAVLYSNCGMPWYRFGQEKSIPKPDPIDGIPVRGHWAFGHNHRMGQLQAAVALAQMGKLDRFVEARRALVEAIEEELRGCPGILTPQPLDNTQSSYWAYGVQINPEESSLNAEEVAAICAKQEGTGPGVYNEIIYLQEVFQEAERTRLTPFGYPLPDHVSYRPGLCPDAEDAARRTLVGLVHHSADPADIRRQWRALRNVMERSCTPGR
jgi:dTDP-4-amino-4,6-dideoxygalactose transaminase